jgi:coenzyme F420 hydrogenase subunit beta
MHDATKICTVVSSGLCCGCGVCAGICPANCLVMACDSTGELAPVQQGKCNNCGLCSKVCPFIADNPDSTEIGKDKFGDQPSVHYQPETGYYRSLYYAHTVDNDVRQASASGGITTWVLKSLLAQRLVDHVITVAPTNNPGQLFEFRIVSSIAALQSTSKSAYYPADVSSIIREATRREGRFAITGLPCMLKGLALALRSCPSLHRRVAFTLGLVCGQQKSRHYSQYLAALAGCVSPVAAVCFRAKQAGQPASNFLFESRDADGKAGRALPFREISHIWTQDWFKIHACNSCDDIYAECADIALMDAWLPQYQHDARGGNLVLVRSPLLETMLMNGARSGELIVEPVALESIMASQSGVIHNKRRGPLMRRRSMLAHGYSDPAPLQRYPVFSTPMKPLLALLVHLTFQLKYTANLLTRNARSHVVRSSTLLQLKLIGQLIRLTESLQRRCR